MMKNCDDMLSRFHLIPEHNGQICYIIARQCADSLTRDKNWYTGR